MTATALQGNPDLVVFCETCRCTVVPLENGRCGWCRTQVADRPARKNPAPRPKPKRAPKPVPPLIPEETDVDERVARLINEAAVVMLRKGTPYASQYRAWFMAGRSGQPPRPPAELLGPAAQLIRGLVVDEAAAARIYGRRRAS